MLFKKERFVRTQIVMIMTSKGHSICISQNENFDECPYCLCKPCITNEQNRQMLWSSEQELPDRKIGLFERKNY